MNIYVVAGQGEGHTTVAAFDAALKQAGVYNYNLVQLSSIIPPGSKIKKIARYKAPKDEYGHKLYIIKAEIRTQEVGKFVAAGIGWYQFADGRGVFVEHEEIAETKIAVESEIRNKIKNTLKDICTFRDIKFRESKMRSVVSLRQVTSGPTCVLVVAVLKSEGWE